jgi:hypothetical protein
MPGIGAGTYLLALWLSHAQPVAVDAWASFNFQRAATSMSAAPKAQAGS